MITSEKEGALPEYYAEASVDGSLPTEEELTTLRRVSGPVPWTAYTIGLVELCERFSYYGTTAVFVNFIQRDLPPGSVTGAGGHEGQSGALGMGQRASTGLTTFNAFWAYTMPLIGAYVADEYWGRYKTIMVAIGVAIVGHIILIISAIPEVIVHPNGAIACFSVGLIIMGIGVGGFKSNISPLIAEQYKQSALEVKTLPSGERVIVDSTLTVSRIYMYFYMMINVGSLAGSVAMVYAEKYVGFWLSFTLPTILFLFCPMIMFLCRNKYSTSPPTGSVTSKAWNACMLAMKGRWSINPVKTYRNLHADDFWDACKPSKIDPASRPTWMTFDDEWVDQLRRGLLACKVFLWYPLYWLAYNQMTNNLTSQAATMQLHGIPNDILGNLNPLSLIIIIPICDIWIYPGLRKAGIRFTPVKRIAMGFMMGTLAMIWSTVTQYYIYKLNPCGDHPNSCTEVAPINVWVQTGAYVFIALSEIFASITGLEYAFTKAPKNMRSLVMAINLFMTAISSALGQALVALSDDPLLVWNYGSVAVLAFIGGVLFWLQNRKLDAEEDALNMLPESNFEGIVKENSFGDHS
ncbi:MFS peptide transporter [Sphaerosporella brunnea]|uniref:MFS peptide transporter n=1 Tax=Sphaerosporella brunnea TaxID=1250544 RepID=A0A5J5EJW4_9PEZI|nr:MFS peptide transporter [Sphaerosporella brunnea]